MVETARRTTVIARRVSLLSGLMMAQSHGGGRQGLRTTGVIKHLLMLRHYPRGVHFQLLRVAVATTIETVAAIAKDNVARDNIRLVVQMTP